MWGGYTCRLVSFSFSLQDHAPVCRVLLCSRQHQPDNSQRTDHAAAGTAAGEASAGEAPPQGYKGSRPSPLVTPSWLLQVEVENFVLRVAAEFSSRKEQLVFLINNYDMMLGVLMVTYALALLPIFPTPSLPISPSLQLSVSPPPCSLPRDCKLPLLS